MATYSQKNQPPESKHGEYRAPRRRSSLDALLTFLIMIVAIIFVMSVFFRVSDVRVEGNVHYTDEEIINASGIEKGDNLFFFDKFAAVSRAYTKLPYLEVVTVDRQLPNRVTINVEECQALAYLSIGDEEWTIDHSCKILGKANEDELEGLIPIYGIEPGTLMIGERLETKTGDTALVDSLAEILYQIEQRGMAGESRRIDFSNPYAILFVYTEKYNVILGGGGSIERKFAMLESVISQLKSGDIGTIDLSDINTAHFIPN